MRVAVVTTASDSWKELTDITIPNMRAYCEKRGYAFAVRRIPEKFEFLKIDAILAAFLFADVVFCLDADVLITNHNVRVEYFLDSAHDFYITEDINCINIGSVIVKNTPWAIGFLRSVLFNKEGYENEQTFLMHQLRSHPQSPVKILPHPSINSYPYDEYAPTYGLIQGWTPTFMIEGKPTHAQGNWRPGDFICHLPGMTLQKRVQIYNKLKEQIVL